MTREELERRVRMLLPLGSMKRAEAEATAAAITRLVVEACAASLEQRFSNPSEKWFAAETSDFLRSTFLPTEKPGGE